MICAQTQSPDGTAAACTPLLPSPSTLDLHLHILFECVCHFTPWCVADGWGGVKENKWELYRMPIKASFADAWHRACANDLFCGGNDGNYFSCAEDYHQQIAAEETLAAEVALNASIEAQLAADAAVEAAERKLPPWGIALIVIAGSIAVAFLFCLGCAFFPEQPKQGAREGGGGTALTQPLSGPDPTPHPYFPVLMLRYIMRKEMATGEPLFASIQHPTQKSGASA